MSDSLISRKAVMEEIHNFVEAHRNDDEVSWTGLDWLLKEDDVVAMISNVPTAYDVDKVVERLEENGQKMSEAKSNTPYGKSTPGCHNYYKAISVKRAVEIVKGGGVDE